MDKGLIPRRYAKALYEVACERGCDEKLYALMQQLCLSFSSNPAMGNTIANPFVSNADKAVLLKQAVYGTDESVHENVYDDFVSLLLKNGRDDQAREVALAYIDLYRKKNKIFRVTVCSAAPLGQSEKSRLADIISKHIGEGTVEFDYEVNPDLIGGFTVTINSERLDASVRSQLKDLRLKLIN